MATSPLEIRMAHLEGAYEQINSRLGVIEERLGRMEDRFGRLEDGFGLLGDRFARLEDKIDVRIDRLRSELLSRMDRQFYWILSLVVVSILVPLFLRLLSA